jgi:glycosyltransferase involved in cell wall biosynthesis
MNIGFDGKRAYHNQTGLGHYSRTLINSLAQYYPQHQYFLFNPRSSSLFQFKEENVHEVLPMWFPATFFRSAWRSSWVKKDLERLDIDLYHGLSHEIPIRIQNTKVKSVVTIHDLIHERYPEQYAAIDVKIYRKKFQYACKNADKVITVSEQTKRDIVDFYSVPSEKIAVTYQSCNPAFASQLDGAHKRIVQLKYGLPPKYFLYVGSIIERKNLMGLCKAVFILRDEIQIPLVVIGDGGKYKQQVKDFVRQNNLEKKIIFLAEQRAARSSKSFQNAQDFPAIYQSAIAMIYPSFFEGFGIPILESLWSRLPVITAAISSLPEVAGDAAYYVDPHRAEEIAEGMRRICGDETMANDFKEKGLRQAQKFTSQLCAGRVMDVYRDLIL